MATILITGSTDGIGLLTAQKLVGAGHHVLLHGRSPEKLAQAAAQTGAPETYTADLSRMAEVDALADAILRKHDRLDVLINNAGVYKMAQPRTPEGLDARFVVNTLAPARLATRLLPAIPAQGRVISLSSAAQAPVDLAAMAGQQELDDFAAYAQSKLALTIWSQVMAQTHPQVFIAVNPGSLLASKMVKEGWGLAGNDLNIGADILIRAALDESFATASGQYFDNDGAGFTAPHGAAADGAHVAAVMEMIARLTGQLLPGA